MSQCAVVKSTERKGEGRGRMGEREKTNGSGVLGEAGQIVIFEFSRSFLRLYKIAFTRSVLTIVV